MSNFSKDDNNPAGRSRANHYIIRHSRDRGGTSTRSTEENAEIPSHPPCHTDTSLESVPCIVPAVKAHNWSSTANSTSFLFDQALKAKYLWTHTTVAGHSVLDTSFPTPFSPNSPQAAQDAGTELGSFTTEQIYDAKREDLEGEDLSRPRW